MKLYLLSIIFLFTISSCSKNENELKPESEKQKSSDSVSDNKTSKIETDTANLSKASFSTYHPLMTWLGANVSGLPRL